MISDLPREAEAEAEAQAARFKIFGDWEYSRNAVRLVDVAAMMYFSVRLADVLDVMSAATRIAVHFRHSASRGNTKTLLISISISPCRVCLRGYSRLLAVLGVWSTITVGNRGGRTGHSGVV